MVAIQFIRENPEAVAKAAKRKNISFDVDALLAVDKERRNVQQACDALKAKQNNANAGIASAQGAEKQAAIQAMKAKCSNQNFQKWKIDFIHLCFSCQILFLIKFQSGKEKMKML
jgi:seryl-tRNA synthetase